MQNLMLAARALGLGSRPTTMHRHYESDIKQLMGIPQTVDIAAIIPLGYPGEGERFGGKRFRFRRTWRCYPDLPAIGGSSTSLQSSGPASCSLIPNA